MHPHCKSPVVVTAVSFLALLAGGLAFRTPSGQERGQTVAAETSAPAVSPGRMKPADQAAAPTSTTSLHTPAVPAPQPSAPAAGDSAAIEPSSAWEQPGHGPAFARFADWAGRYVSAGQGGGSPALVREGRTLAEERRAALAGMIQTDPERALAMGVPAAVRQRLPAEVTTLLERRVSGRGQLAVFGVAPLPGQEQETIPLVRTATLDGKTYKAFVYGRRLGAPTREDLPMHGIAVDNLLAIHESPGRPLEPEEVAQVKAVGPTAFCPIDGLASGAGAEERWLDCGGELFCFCSQAHAQAFLTQAMAAETQGGGAGGGLPTAQSTYTEGRKRFLIYRVDFPDDPGEHVSTNDALGVINSLNTFYTQSSYEHTTVATAGAGSDVTPVMRLPLTTDNYTDFGTFLGACRTAADSLGYDRGRYDFDIVLTTSRPSAGFAGIAFVGGTGTWLANGYFGMGVAAHEVGHNLGLNHANFWNTAGQSVIGPGGSDEYGDPFDTMGGAGGLPSQYSIRYKQMLDWIPAGDLPTVTGSGLQRLYTFDLPEARQGVRGLRIPKTTTLNYFVEFRQGYTGNNWMLNGIGLRWIGNGSGDSSLLLDTTPGTRFGKDDSPVVIGRTFSDLEHNIHLTPIGKGNTYPESNKIDGATLVLVDINALKLSERAAEAARAGLEQLAEDKDELMGIMTHDLKNLLSGMQMSAERLRDSSGSLADPKLRQMVENISYSSSQMLAFVKEFLANASFGHGLTIKAESISLWEAAARVVGQYQEAARRKQLVLHEVLPEENAVVRADPGALSQVLGNLLSNAVKFSPPGKEISIGVRSEESYVACYVQDQGPGFTEEDKTRMFQRYGQALGAADGRGAFRRAGPEHRQEACGGDGWRADL